MSGTSLKARTYTTDGRGAPADIVRRRVVYLQENQPEGVPPLSLTGERTLPDVPEENYWFRRHLVVYEWIAARAHGRRIVDLACGEGYGSAVLGRTAESVVGVDANPEAFEHARLKYTRANVRFERNMIELWRGDVDCVVFLQTIEHVQDPDAVLERDPRADRPARGRVRLHAQRADAGAEGRGALGESLARARVPAGGVLELCSRHFGSVDMLGLFHARKLRCHQWAIEHAGWDDVHARWGSRSRSTTGSRRRSRCVTSSCGAASSTCSRSPGQPAVLDGRRGRSLRFIAPNHLAESPLPVRRGAGDPIGAEGRCAGRIAAIVRRSAGLARARQLTP